MTALYKCLSGTQFDKKVSIAVKGIRLLSLSNWSIKTESGIIRMMSTVSKNSDKDPKGQFSKPNNELFEHSGVFQDGLKNHLFEESAALNVYDMTTANLAAGCPGPDLLCTLPEMFKKATQHRMDAEAENRCFMFQYGPAAGLWPFRDQLAIFLTKQYKQPVDRADLVLTCGATHGLHLTLSTLLAPNGVIFVEEFTYMIALNLFKEFPAFKVISVPMTPNGVDVEQFRKIAGDTKSKNTWNISEDKPFWAMFYTIPNFHNPTGTLLPPESCKKLVDAVRELDILVLCDDVYNLLYYGPEDAPPPRLRFYDAPGSPGYCGGHVVSNGSFSKILSPGVRVGWLETHPRIAKRLRQSGILQSGGSVNNVMFGLMQSMLELGLAEQQLVWYNKIYKERMSTLCKGLKRHLPSSCSFQSSEGGYFLWVLTPCDAAAFLVWCASNGGPGAVPSTRFRMTSEQKSGSHAIRLSIGFHDKEMLEKAAEDLGNKLKMYIESNQN